MFKERLSFLRSTPCCSRVCTMGRWTDGETEHRSSFQLRTAFLCPRKGRGLAEGLLWVASFPTTALRRTESVLINSKTSLNIRAQNLAVQSWVRLETCQQCWDFPTWTLCWNVITRWEGPGDLATGRESVHAGVTDSEMSLEETKIIRNRQTPTWDPRGDGITVWWTIRRTTTMMRMMTRGTSRDRSPSTDNSTGWRCRDKK